MEMKAYERGSALCLLNVGRETVSSGSGHVCIFCNYQ